MLFLIQYFLTVVSWYAHMLYVHAPSLILHTYWEFSDSHIFAHTGPCILYFADQVFREDHTHNEPEFSLFDRSVSVSFLVYPLFLLIILILNIVWTQFYSI